MVYWYYSKMEGWKTMQETFTAGVELGGLYTRAEIKSLIGYMLYTVGEPMPRQMVLDVLTGNGIANYFDCCAALDELEHADNFHITDEGLTLTDVGRQVVETLGNRVRYGLREKAVASALKLLTRRKRARENTVTVEKLPRGCAVTCVTEEGDAPLLSITLRVADTEQAAFIRERFLADPTRLYQAVIEVLTQEEHVDK